jgi:hypothetical protein
MGCSCGRREIVELGVGRSFISGYEGLVFVSIFVAGLAFEMAWSARHDTNVLKIDKKEVFSRSYPIAWRFYRKTAAHTAFPACAVRARPSLGGPTKAYVLDLR